MLTVSIVAENVDRINDNIDKIASDKRHRAIYKWLSPPDPSTNHNRAAELRHGSSGGWFLRSNAYLKWKTDSQSFVWLNGKPGSGKTILTSTVIEDLREQESDSSSLLYFYFSFSDNSKQHFKQMMYSLIWQLYCKQLNTRGLLDSLWEIHEKDGTQPDLGSICSVFNDMLQETSEVWIVLDALDESQNSQPQSKWDLFSWIQQLRDIELKLHLFMTSRQEHDIEAELRDSIKYEETVSLHNSSVNTDIYDYVKARVTTDLRRWSNQPELRREIEETLAGKADGM